MKPFKVTYNVAIEREFEPSEWKREGVWKSPILPVAGLWVDVGDGNFREIDDVYIWPENPGEIDIHFVAEGDDCVRAPELMAADGWEQSA